MWSNASEFDIDEAGENATKLVLIASAFKTGIFYAISAPILPYRQIFQCQKKAKAKDERIINRKLGDVIGIYMFRNIEIVVP